jgi:DNA mismatch endonuclease (patch repair protein)
LPRKKKAVFIDGDFWHGRDSNKFKKLPKEYWQPKIRRNIERDKVNAKLLKESGWTFIRIWESDINRKSTREETLKKIKAFLLAKSDRLFLVGFAADAELAGGGEDAGYG